eukprot:m.299504 g.299504  ORF g.299504 m.299504 type:complete len:81 (-) comp283671_c0_seq1:14-256(-)
MTTTSLFPLQLQNNTATTTTTPKQHQSSHSKRNMQNEDDANKQRNETKKQHTFRLNIRSDSPRGPHTREHTHSTLLLTMP